jgi:redox-sensing transcriptional repressor
MKKSNNNINSKILVPVPTIRRLPMYLSFLKLVNNNIRYISAPEIAADLHIDPTQISKDFSAINITGKTKIGYEIIALIDTLEQYLGYQILRKGLIVGVGNLGTALIQFSEFKKEGLAIVAGFDIDSEKIGSKINGVQIFDIDAFDQVINNSHIDIGIITVPASQAQLVADNMIASGIKAIWNFSPRPISAPKNIIVENTSIDSGLAMIKWKLNKNKPLIYKNRIL